MENSKLSSQLAMSKTQESKNGAEPKRKRTSPLWDFFTQLNERFAECNTCKKCIPYKSLYANCYMHGNLSRHLETHTNKKQNKAEDSNEELPETAEYEDDGTSPSEPPAKKQKTAKVPKRNEFSSRKDSKNTAIRKKPGPKPGFGASKAKKVSFSVLGKKNKFKAARAKGSGQKLNLNKGDKNKNMTLKPKVQLKKLSVEDLIQAKVKTEVIEDYFGDISLPSKSSFVAPPSKIKAISPVNTNPPLPMIQSKDQDKPQLLKTYNNIKTQGDMIEAMIQDALPTLPVDKVREIYNFLVEMGVENADDLEYLEVEDLNKVLKPIQSRKLLAIWKNKGVISQFQNQTSVPSATQLPENSPSTQSANIVGWPQMNTVEPSVHEVCSESTPKPKDKPKPKVESIKFGTKSKKKPKNQAKHKESETPLPLPLPKDWTDTFDIPWNKLSPEIMKCLSKKKRPNRTERFVIIHTVADDILEVCKAPTLSELRKICEKMAQKFPQAFGDEDGSGECKKLVDWLQNRIRYLRRDDEKESENLFENEEIKSSEPNFSVKEKPCLTSKSKNSTMSKSKPVKAAVTSRTDLSRPKLPSTSATSNTDLSKSESPSTSLAQRKYPPSFGSPSKPFPKNEFEIPWNKMPQTLLDSLNRNETLTKHDKDILIAIVIDQYLLWNPEQGNIKATTRKIAESMCEIYPLSLSDAAFRVDGGGQYSSSALHKCLHSKVYNIRRGLCRKKHYKIIEESQGTKTESVESVHSSKDTKFSESRRSSLSVCGSPLKSAKTEFAIPWLKLDETLLSTLNQNKQLTPSQIGSLVLAVSNEILQKKTRMQTIAKIAEKLCKKYPTSLSGVALGSDNEGIPGSALASLLKAKLCELRSAKKCKSWLSRCDGKEEMPESFSSEDSKVMLSSFLSSSDVPCPTEEEKSLPVRFDIGDFYIPWHKLDASHLNNLQEGKRFSIEDKDSLVTILCNEFWEWQKPKKLKINPYQCGKALATRLVDLYPNSLSNHALGRAQCTKSDFSRCLCDTFKFRFLKLQKKSSTPKPKLKKQKSIEQDRHQCFCDDCPFRSLEFAADFEIPWEEMPQELQESLRKNEPLSPNLRSEMVGIISRAILKIDESPSKDCVDLVAEKACSTYPKSLCIDGADKDHEILGREILFRIHRINNDRKSVDEHIKDNKNEDSTQTSLPSGEQSIKNTCSKDVSMDVDLNCTISSLQKCSHLNIHSDDDAKKDHRVKSEADEARMEEECFMETLKDLIQFASDKNEKSTIIQKDSSSDCGVKSADIESESKTYPNIIKCCDIKSEVVSAKEVLDCSETPVASLTTLAVNSNKESMTDQTLDAASEGNEISNWYPDNVSTDSGVESPNPEENRGIVILSAVSVSEESPSLNLVNTKTSPKTYMDKGVGTSSKSATDSNDTALICTTEAAIDMVLNNHSEHSKTSHATSSYHSEPAVNTASDDCSKTYQSDLTNQNKAVSVCNTELVGYQSNFVLDSFSPSMPGNVHSNFNPEPQTHPVTMVPNCPSPINTLVQSTQMTNLSSPVMQPSPMPSFSPNMNTAVQANPMPNYSPTMNTAVQANPMQNYSPTMNSFVQPNPMQSYSPTMNSLVQSNPVTYQPVMVPNYNANPVTCWPPPVVVPSYSNQPMVCSSNMAQNCNNEVLYAGYFGSNSAENQVAHSINMQPMVSYNGVNTCIYQQAAGTSSAYSHGSNAGVQYCQNMSQIVKTEESEPS